MSLNNVKACYFLKILFSHLNERRKLRIINYSKSLQNVLNINIINYKILYGKYIEYESNGKAKEFSSYDDHLIYEGDYFNGKRNGKGKEYDEDERLKFEGEYLNGKRNGKGKEYDIYGDEIIFEGEYLNGKRWNGKIYDHDGHSTYELKNGNGYFKEYYEDENYLSLEFEGVYKNGEKNGKGKEYYDYVNNKLRFDGEYLNGKKWNGKLFDEHGIIICEIKDGKGSLKEYNRNKVLIYEAKFLNGELNGKVREFNDEGQLIFEGEDLCGILNGKVKEYEYGRISFEGEYLYGHKRKGKEYMGERLEYEGEYLFDKKWSGKGYDKNGNIIYELINGNGKVKEYYFRCFLKFEGEYLNGKKNGKGKEYDSDGKLRFEGEYLNGKRNGKGKESNYFIISGTIEFQGEYLNGKKWNGKGKEFEKDSSTEILVE